MIPAKEIKGLVTLLSLSIILVFTFLCAKTSAAAKKDDHPWCYKDAACAPNHWAAQCQTGKTQSPVDFRVDKIDKKEKELRLRFNTAYMDVQQHFFIKNNGHTIQVQLNEDFKSNLLMDGDGLAGSYVFSQLHFHWGSHDDVGSEHTVNGNSYPVELHLVHYGNSYSSLGDAVASKNHRALTVLGIFFEISANDNPSIKPIIDAMSQVQDVTSDLKAIHSASLNISALLPKDLSLFRYYGSLTTPSCNEIVHWNVFQKAVGISRAQLDIFRNIRDGHGDKMVDNFRPPQPLGTRRVAKYDKVDLGHKPEPDVKDEMTPSPDVDYEDAEKNFDSSARGKSTDKKNAAGKNILSSFVLGFVSLAVTILANKNNFN